MDEEGAPPASPPLPKRGAYSIDFDSIDESTNPFATKSKVGFGSSPPINSTVTEFDFDETENPFKPSKAMANSPPGSPITHSPLNKTTAVADSEEAKDVSQSNALSHDNSNVLNNVMEYADTNEDKPRPQTIPKKKKMIKKPKAQSKIKLPKNLPKEPQNDSDEIQIFMPGTDVDNNNKVSEPVKDFDSELGNVNEFGEEEDPPLDAAPEAMASSLEADHRFVEGEEGVDELVNEAFVASRENCKDADEWALPNNSVKADKKCVEQDKENDFDERRVKPSKESLEHRRKSRDNAILSQTPPPPPHPSESSEGSRAKHPAVRALETAQTESVAGPGKCEPSSEESQFYDAYDYPPPTSSQAISGGQTIPNTMEKGVEDGQGDQNKGTVVQLVQVLRYSQSDWNKMKQELELNYQASLLNKERDWSLLLADRDKKISSLSDTSKKLKATNEDMRMVVAEFEKTISQLQADKEKSRTESHKSLHDLEVERDQALEDLQSVESAFSDLHRRYEKSKSIIEGFKRNEEQLKSCMEDLQGKLKKSEVKLLALRSQAEEKLDRANEDIEKIKKSTRSEVVRLEAALKKAELRISSLEESLQRKEKENQELTAICDELIAKVGS